MISSAVRWLSLLTHSLSPVPMGAAESSSVPAAPPETLPDFFPLAPKACASQSAKFFECFATKGIQNAGEEVCVFLPSFGKVARRIRTPDRRPSRTVRGPSPPTRSA
mmetsp:Transcript_10765/g.35663  ORF Transcript_10765/g.35663 Transcript_10765/m.35663 type:complete len:107 (-) Transcript_10765:631-951(-)